MGSAPLCCAGSAAQGNGWMHRQVLAASRHSAAGRPSTAEWRATFSHAQVKSWSEVPQTTVIRQWSLPSPAFSSPCPFPVARPTLFHQHTTSFCHLKQPVRNPKKCLLIQVIVRLISACWKKYQRYLVHGCTHLVSAGGEAKHLTVEEGDICSGELRSDRQAQEVIEAGDVILKQDTKQLVSLHTRQNKSTFPEIRHKRSLTDSMFSLWRTVELCKVLLWRQVVCRKPASGY